MGQLINFKWPKNGLLWGKRAVEAHATLQPLIYFQLAYSGSCLNGPQIRAEARAERPPAQCSLPVQEPEFQAL